LTACITTEKELTEMPRLHLRAINLKNFRQNQKEETRKPRLYLRVCVLTVCTKTKGTDRITKVIPEGFIV